MEVPCLGIGGSVGVDLISELQLEDGRSLHLTYDNLFTSLKPVDCVIKNKKHRLHRNNPRQQNRGQSTEVCEGDGKVQAREL